jgi:hypothetical protein
LNFRAKNFTTKTTIRNIFRFKGRKSYLYFRAKNLTTKTIIRNIFRLEGRKSYLNFHAKNFTTTTTTAKIFRFEGRKSYLNFRAKNFTTTNKEFSVWRTEVWTLSDFCLFFQKIVLNLKKDTFLKSKKVEEITGNTLDYLKSRDSLWKSQAEKNSSGRKIIDFSPENLNRFYNNLPHVSNLDRTRCLAGCEESFVP